MQLMFYEVAAVLKVAKNDVHLFPAGTFRKAESERPIGLEREICFGLYGV